MSLMELFRGHGWESIMLFPILQNEKEKKNATTYEAIEIFELSAYKLPLAMISNFLHFLLCGIQLRICQTKKIEYLFRSGVKIAFYISLGKTAFLRKCTDC